MSRIVSVLRTLFTLDLRSLALARIMLGALIVVDALTRLRDVEIFYSDAGVSKHAPFLKTLWPSPRPSLYALSGDVEFAAALLVLTAVFGALFAIGFRTRVVAVLTYVLVLSVQNRNGGINTGADGVLILFLLYALFLPMGARFSVDARRARATATTTTTSTTLWSAATTAWVLQLVCLYFFNTVNKNGHTWKNGTAVWQALHIDEHATIVGVWLREHARFLSGPLTYGTLLVEISVLLLLLPVGLRVVRPALVAAFWALHIGFAACFYIALFSPLSMAAWLAVLPSSVWALRPLSRFAGASAPSSSEPSTSEPSSSTSSPSSSSPLRRVGALAAGVFVLAVVAGQFTVNSAKTFGFQAPWAYSFLRPLQAHPLWKMFASNPGRNDGWWIVDGAFADGRHLDLARPGLPAVTKKKPALVATLYPTGRWRKFMMENAEEGAKTQRRRYAEYLCRHHNAGAAPEARLTSVTLTWMHEVTPRSLRSQDAKAKPKAMGTFPCKS
jgi:hypothetical protein